MNQKLKLGKDGWNALYKWSLENMDSQGSQESSSFHGKTEKEIQEDIDFLQKVIENTSIDIGQEIKKHLVAMKSGKLKRNEYIQHLVEIEDYVENLDFADLFHRLNGLESLYRDIIINEKIEWDDIKIYCLKIIGVCLFNTEMFRFNTLKLYDIVITLLQKYKSKKEKESKDYLKSLIYALSSFSKTTMIQRKEKKQSFSEKLIKSDLCLLIDILREQRALDIKQKVLSLLIALFIDCDENEKIRNLYPLILLKKTKFLTVSISELNSLLDRKKEEKNDSSVEIYSTILIEKFLNVLFECIKVFDNKNSKTLDFVRGEFSKNSKEFIKVFERIVKVIDKEENFEIVEKIEKIKKIL